MGKKSEKPAPTCSHFPKATQRGQGRWRRKGVDSLVPPLCWFCPSNWRRENPDLGVVALCGSASCSCKGCSRASGLERGVFWCSTSRAACNGVLTGTAPEATGTREVTIPSVLLLRLSGSDCWGLLVDVRHAMLP